MLALLDGRQLGAEVKQAADLLATVVGQDLEQTEDGIFRIARRVAPDRVISTVDPEARHGHKTEARGYDGFKGHVAIDPDSEIITAAEVTAANVSDGSVVKELLADVIPLPSTPSEDSFVDAQATPTVAAAEGPPPPAVAASEPIEVYGDASYGTAEVLEHLEQAGVVANVKVQAADGARRALHEGRVPDRSRERHGDLPRRPLGPDPPTRRWIRAGKLRHRLQLMSPRIVVHQEQVGPNDSAAQGRPPGARSTQAPARTSVACELQGHAPRRSNESSGT